MTPEIFTVDLPSEDAGAPVKTYTFRHTPLAAIPAVREYNKLIKRVDKDTGTLDMLAMTFSQEDHAAMGDMSLTGILLWVKSLSTTLGDEDLADVCLYFMTLGKVQMRVDLPTGEHWIDVQTEEECGVLPDASLLASATYRVIRGLLRPFFNLLPSLSAKVSGAVSGSTTSSSEASDARPAPTSTSES